MNTVTHETSHAFDVADAIKHGVNKAILLANIGYWCRHNAMNEINFHDGRYWTYNTCKAFAKQFPYMSKTIIERLLREMERDGLILVQNYNKKNYDRTKWYAIPCTAPTFKNEAGFAQEDAHPASNLKQPCLKNEAPIPDINIPDVNSTNTCASVDTPEAKLHHLAIKSVFDVIWNEYPYKKHRKRAETIFHKLVKSMGATEILEFRDKLGVSIRSKNTENAIGWSNTLFASYLNGECWNDEVSTGQPVKQALDMAARFPATMTQFLSGAWPRISDMDRETQVILMYGIENGLIKKQENLDRLTQFGFMRGNDE